MDVRPNCPNCGELATFTNCNPDTYFGDFLICDGCGNLTDDNEILAANPEFIHA